MRIKLNYIILYIVLTNYFASYSFSFRFEICKSFCYIQFNSFQCMFCLNLLPAQPLALFHRTNQQINKIYSIVSLISQFQLHLQFIFVNIPFNLVVVYVVIQSVYNTYNIVACVWNPLSTVRPPLAVHTRLHLNWHGYFK